MGKDIFFELIDKIIDEEAELLVKTRTYQRTEREAKTAEQKRRHAHVPVALLQNSIAIHREALEVMRQTKRYSKEEVEQIIERYRKAREQPAEGTAPEK